MNGTVLFVALALAVAGTAAEHGRPKQGDGWNAGAVKGGKAQPGAERAGVKHGDARCSWTCTRHPDPKEPMNYNKSRYTWDFHAQGGMCGAEACVPNEYELRDKNLERRIDLAASCNGSVEVDGIERPYDYTGWQIEGICHPERGAEKLKLPPCEASFTRVRRAGTKSLPRCLIDAEIRLDLPYATYFQSVIASSVGRDWPTDEEGNYIEGGRPFFQIQSEEMLEAVNGSLRWDLDQRKGAPGPITARAGLGWTISDSQLLDALAHEGALSLYFNTTTMGKTHCRAQLSLEQVNQCRGYLGLPPRAAVPVIPEVETLLRPPGRPR